MASRPQQPAWTQPTGGVDLGVHVANSLTLGRKVPLVPASGRVLRWYNCGPTVYNVSHLGHARVYSSMDTIRRILTDYFGYQVFLCMNITDIDDKIIKRANEDGVNFREIAAKYEHEFFEDMAALGVRMPDVVTRVSEYVPEVIAYVQRILDNGFAYVVNRSVYFDTTKFREAGFHYAHLEPTSVGDADKFAEGEGVLAAELQGDTKRHPNDFVLWKASKENEPSWESPWGPGRPGWHIECSAMADSVLGRTMDIHSGGIDLRFPHHDNEIAQAEAHNNDHKPWVNYFFHAGHLHIAGQKMSKSKKNFTTIREFLDAFTSRQIRLLFLLHQYDEPMDYSPDVMQSIVAVERRFIEFFHTVARLVREIDTDKVAAWRPSDRELHAKLLQVQADVDARLRDNFATPHVVRLLQELVTVANTYMSQAEPRLAIVRSVATFVRRMLGVLGVLNDNDVALTGAGSGESDAKLRQVLDALCSFRDSVRAAARAKASVLEVCDSVRDSLLPPLGVRLEDLPDDKSTWKLEDAAELMREIARKAEEKAEREAAKAAAAFKREQERLAKLERARVPPADYFRKFFADEYTAFDDAGFPTADKEGKPVSKNQVKKLEKELERHKKEHEAVVAADAGASSK